MAGVSAAWRGALLVTTALHALLLWGGHREASASAAADVLLDAGPSVVMIVTYDVTGAPRGQGSGFFVKPGQILTNAHVMEKAYSAQVLSVYGRYEDVTILKEDEDLDLALLEVEDAGEPHLRPSTLEPYPGQRIIVIGNPMGLEHTVSDGLVSAIRIAPDGTELLQISAPISPGSSGGPVLNEHGRVMGVATATIEGGQNLNFAISTTTVREFLDRDDSPRELRKAKSRVFFRVVLKRIGQGVLVIVGLLFTGLWFIPVLAVTLIVTAIVAAVKGIRRLFRRKARAAATVNSYNSGTSLSDDLDDLDADENENEEEEEPEKEDLLDLDDKLFEDEEHFVFHCWKCGGLIRLPRDYSQQRTPCDECGTLVDVPRG